VPERLNIVTAGELLDFSGGEVGGVISPAVAQEQLRGAVATHNLLVDQRIAYLADEVGMGKTYMALGAIALFRHFDPAFSVLVIAPRENIQDKWIREWKAFTARVVRFDDMRMRGIGGAPVRALVKASSLSDLVTAVGRDPDRDFFARLTSFSIAATSATESSAKHRGMMLRALPWLDRELLDLRSPDIYKRNFGRAVNVALPKFDLMVIDEGHNLKAGWHDGRGATRNLVLGCALGGKDSEAAVSDGFHAYSPRAERVLFLSATPIEDDFRQLWNQIDLLGLGDRWKGLADAALSDEDKREIARQLVIRRVGRLQAGDQQLTKNQYRREWRHGGVKIHDDPMSPPDDRQRLTVALVQKKVAELLGDARHNHSFQVGLLASFESFAQTAKSTSTVTSSGAQDVEQDQSPFYMEAEEARSAKNRDGLDVDAINEIARDYQRRFNGALPHPKMDALVDELASAFASGRKALVFVRRVASVDEIQRKVEERYDKWLTDRLLRDANSPTLQEELEAQIRSYRELRAAKRSDMRATDDARAPSARGLADREESTSESFFSWFFRGDGPDKVLSGARLAGRFDSPSGAYSTFFEDNYVAAVLDVPPAQAFSALAAVLQIDESALADRLGNRARAFVPASSRTQRRESFHAFQHAALEALTSQAGIVRDRARVILRDTFSNRNALNRSSDPISDAQEWLATETLFTKLRERPALRSSLWPEPDIATFANRFRERELRRMLFATIARKGHPITDLFSIVANRVGTLRAGKRDLGDDDEHDLATEFLDRLDQQSRTSEGFSSFIELAGASLAFRLIVSQNVPDIRDAALSDVPRILGRLVGSQRPVGGMAGAVNGVLVKQFRMPGYPLVLITTDLLQEGEDLHTFCSDVYHYGIAWMPSALEQRVGRIDRIGSLTERRLLTLGRAPSGDEKLQVFYPHLRDTVEVIQVRRVLHRLNRFLLLMHEDLGMPETEDSSIDVKESMLRPPVDLLPIDRPFTSAFDVNGGMLRAHPRALMARRSTAQATAEDFDQAARELTDVDAVVLDDAAPQRRTGKRQIGGRIQPFTLLLRSIRGRPVVRCISPVGRLRRTDFNAELLAPIAARPFVRISLVHDERIDSYEIAVEGDALMERTPADVLKRLVVAVTTAADDIEKAHFEEDPDYAGVWDDLQKEADVAR
jgi:Type III restriction enzyme, res subunit/Helicase conserved C-terminal domain